MISFLNGGNLKFTTLGLSGIDMVISLRRRYDQKVNAMID